MKMLCPAKHDDWKCSEGYDQAYENLVLSLPLNPKTTLSLTPAVEVRLPRKVNQ